MSKQYVIIRNSKTKSMFDVVEVDYDNETATHVEQELTFMEASGKVEELNEKSKSTLSVTL